MKSAIRCGRCTILILSVLVFILLVIYSSVISVNDWKYDKLLRTPFSFSFHESQSTYQRFELQGEAGLPKENAEENDILNKSQHGRTSSDPPITTIRLTSKIPVFTITPSIIRTVTVSASNKLHQKPKNQSSVSTSPSVPPSQSSQPATSASASKKYLIYLCSPEVRCLGFADRQRGIVSVYLMAQVTGRQFGINMTYPWNFRDFYMPSEDDWDIPASQLAGKSTKIITYLMGSSYDSKELRTIDFNAVYPEEVIYIRSNFQLWFELLQNPLYKWLLPVWSRRRRCHTFANAWPKIAKPTPELRSALNQVLADIALSMLTSAQTETNSSNAAGVNGSLGPSLQPNMSLDQIYQMKDYEVAKLNLVCIHVRLGHSETMPFETGVRNKPEYLSVLWEFLKSYVLKGHHIYIASDSHKVRQEGKEQFGDRIHFIQSSVIHVDNVRKDSKDREGLKAVLLEQLLLMSSCEVLVVSKSGFSMIAAYVRMHLMGWEGNFFFNQNNITTWGLW